MKVWGFLLWTRWVGDLLYFVANSFRIYGDEAVLDFYIDVTAALSLFMAIALVALAHRWWTRHADFSPERS